MEFPGLDSKPETATLLLLVVISAGKTCCDTAGTTVVVGAIGSEATMMMNLFLL